MTTGLHRVRDISCGKCGQTMGWKYVRSLSSCYSHKTEGYSYVGPSIRAVSEVQGGQIDPREGAPYRDYSSSKLHPKRLSSLLDLFRKRRSTHTFLTGWYSQQSDSIGLHRDRFGNLPTKLQQSDWDQSLTTSAKPDLRHAELRNGFSAFEPLCSIYRSATAGR